MTLLFKTLSHLPLWLLHGIGWLLGWITFWASAVYRQRFQTNVARAGLARADWMRAVGAAGQLLAELPRIWFGKPPPLRWDGAQHIEAALASGKGVLFLTPHMGCFEVCAQAYASRYGQHNNRPMTVLFRPPRKTWLASLVAQSRARPGLLAAPTTMAGVRQMLKALKKGECVGLLPDQVPPAAQGLWVPFFGVDAYTMTLSARLVHQTGAAVLLAWGQRLSWGRGYVVHYRPLGETLSEDLPTAVAQINRAMEGLIRECPGQYLWGYARYKAPREAL